MQIKYNRFDPGVKQDDFLTGGPSFIEHKNMDGLRDGYGITLGPKVNKSVLTSTTPIRSMIANQTGSVDLDETYTGGDLGKIYKFNSTDNTPAFTLANGKNIIKTVLLGNSLFFFYKGSLASTSYGMAKINKNDAETNNWAAIDENFKIEGTFSSVGIPPVIIIGPFMYFGSGFGAIARMDEGGTVTSFAIPDDHVSAITIQGSIIGVYSRSGNVYFWDGGSITESARGLLGARCQKADTLDGRDYITTEDGQSKIGSYTSFQRLTKPKKSFRLEDNSTLSDRLNFINNDTDGHQDHTIRVAKDDVYFFNSDTIPGIYKYGNVIPGLAKGFHKIITQNHLGTQIDVIYDMYYYERTARRLYFSYKADTTYGIDYIELDSLATNTTGYAVTEVFTGGTSFKKEINRVRVNVSNVDANNTIDLYYRINNQDWTLLRTINSTTDDIYYRENITTESTGVAIKNFIDIQFKVEFTSANGDNTPPTLHELMLDYDIIET